MRVQISSTQHQNVKSNSNRKSYLNVEDIIFQMSVLKLGIAYHQTMMYNVRTMKGYNHHQKRYDLFMGVHGWLQMTDIYQSHQSALALERSILINDFSKAI